MSSPCFQRINPDDIEIISEEEAKTPGIADLPLHKRPTFGKIGNINNSGKRVGLILDFETKQRYLVNKFPEDKIGEYDEFAAKSYDFEEKEPEEELDS